MWQQYIHGHSSLFHSTASISSREVGVARQILGDTMSHSTAQYPCWSSCGPMLGPIQPKNCLASMRHSNPAILTTSLSHSHHLSDRNWPQIMEYTRLLFRSPSIANARYPLLISAAISEMLPFVLLLINFSSYLNDEAFPAPFRSNILCAITMIINQFAFNREKLRQAVAVQ